MDLIGQSLGRYHILEQLGEGGMATVFKAYDTRLEREVAIKIIRRDVFPPNEIDRLLKRFEREAKALARLSHPNIVGVIDFGEYESSPYLVMEYLAGGTLKHRLGQLMPWENAVRTVLPIARALQYAHDRNVVHRDVKPANILLTEGGEPMLTDFGIAKILETDETATLTGTGMGIGTPEYMAPEQWVGQAGPQSDIYSLAVVLYELITGRKPFIADTPAAILLKQAHDPLPRPGSLVPGLPDAVERVLLKALAKQPKDRYENMEAFVLALQQLQGVGRTRTRTMSEKPANERSSKLSRLAPYLLGTLTVLVAVILVVIWVDRTRGPAFGPPAAQGEVTATSEPAHIALEQDSTATPPATAATMSQGPIQSTQIDVLANKLWQSTGLSIQRGQSVTISVQSGTWTDWKGNVPYNAGTGHDYVCSENIAANQCAELLPSYYKGALVGRIGGQVFGIGNRAQVTAEAAGQLQLAINDEEAGLFDNDGKLKVKVSVGQQSPLPCVRDQWTISSAGSGTWKCSAGIITGHSSDGESMLLSKQPYRDFSLTTDLSTRNREASLAFHMDKGLNNGYLLVFIPAGATFANSFTGGKGELMLKKRVDGTEYNLQSGQFSPFPAAGENTKITLAVSGSKIIVKLNGAEVINRIDNSFPEGFVGLRIFGASDIPCDASFWNVILE